MVYLQFILISFVFICSHSTSTQLLDEELCLREGKIPCRDGSNCLWDYQICDGNVDCYEDASDEHLCLTPARECLADNMYLCEDKIRCISTTMVCNNATDCLDGSDEFNCTDPLQPSNNATCKGFECSSDKRCISWAWVCDGSYDCADHSDELPHTCRHSGYKEKWESCDIMTVLASLHEYSCREDDQQCLLARYMCDGLADCKDGSDEGDFCKHWGTMCANTTCPGSTACLPTAAGARCRCGYGEAYDAARGACAPVDRCAAPAPVCSHTCLHSAGNMDSFLCHCDDGYSVDRLKISHVCFAPDPEAMLFFSTRDEIKYITLKSKNIVTVATGMKQAHGVSFDGTYVYWVETAQGHQAIMKAPLNNVADTKTVLVGLGLEEPGDISIDWVGGNFYFSDTQRGVISVCDINATMCATLHTDAKVPKHLALDVENGKMYWADWHGAPVIMSARMDGSAPAPLVRELRAFPSGLAVDPPGGRIYFVDRTLKGARLDDGRVFSVERHVDYVHQPYALAVFENSIYWSDWASNTILSRDKLSGRTTGNLATLDSPVFGLYMYHPILTRSGHHPAPLSCSHLRLIGYNNSIICACPDGMELDHTNATCQPLAGYRAQFVAVAGGGRLALVPLGARGGAAPAPARTGLARARALAYDTRRDTLYVYDATWKTIFSLKISEFSRGTTEVLIHMGLDDVVDMDYDYIGDNLYFVDAGRKFVEVVSLKTGKRAVIHRFDQEVPISMCVVPEYGKMLIALSESEQDGDIHIDSFGLDGSGRQHLVTNNLKGPHVRLRYSRKMDNVYVADEGNSVIEHMHVLGTGRETFRALPTAVSGLALSGALVLWTAGRAGRLYWADIHDASPRLRRVPLPFPNTTHLHITATWQPSGIASHPCQLAPCSDVCVLTAQDVPYPIHEGLGNYMPMHLTLDDDSKLKARNMPLYKCLCPPGLVNMDGQCKDILICEEEEAYCHSSNVCIRRSQLCDGRRDCQHGEDEEGCGHSTTIGTTCKANEQMCEDRCIDRNTACVPTSAATSEITTTTEPVRAQCPAAQYLCAGAALCVGRAQLCDGAPDCPRADDEAPALCDTYNCLHTEFMCSSGHCILNSFRCDGEPDCTDGSDEFQCVNKTCPAGYFQCLNFECIEVTKRCDANQDCADFSDEDDCEYPDINEQPEVETCEEWEYTCELNKTICLPFNARCNGKPECPGNTDEEECPGYRCREGWLSCKRDLHCVRPELVCDGRAHCADSSDETPAACGTVNKTSKLYPVRPVYPSEQCHGYRCGDGQCVEWRSVCDRVEDCADGSDEGGRCLSACAHHNCSGACQPTPLGRQCRCTPGFALGADGATCADRDECDLDLCSQHCYNTQGSFVCGCHRGYALRSDRRSCKAVKGNMSLLYVSGNSVRSITADGQMALEYDNSAASITDMDYDVRRKKLYVTSQEAGMLIEVSGPNRTVSITNIGHPTRVAVDWVTGTVFLADQSAGAPRMRVCNVASHRCARLQKLPLYANVTALVLDPASRKLFYCVSRDLESVIWSSSLAGRHVTQLAVVGDCSGLAVDTYSKRLYVAQTSPARIYTVDYEGNSFKKVLEDDPHLQAPHDLALFEDHVYFLVANSMKLNRCLLFNKKHCEMYLQRMFNANSFLIRHESIQRDDVPDFCEGVKCENVCVQGDLEGICLCDDGAVSKDGSCPLVAQEQLPLFNGWTFRNYQKAHEVSLAVVISLSVLFAIYVSSFLYYHFVYKKKREQMANYIPVHFHNSMAEGTSDGFDGLSPITTPTVQMPAIGATTHDFTNPLQLFKNWKPSFKRSTRPIGTAGLEIDIPALDVSDTESDMDDRDNKKILK